jgi:hypothetical protein
MLGLRTLMLILLAAVFAVGGPLRALPAHADGVPPCHETAGEMTNKAPAHKPRPDLMGVNCCAGCLPASVRDAAPLLSPGAVVRIAFAPLSQTADGLSPAPEHGPPRPFA